MFELATAEKWWSVAKDFEFLRMPGAKVALKSAGYAHLIDIISTHRPRTILEFGHSYTTPLFDLYEDEIEMWDVDRFSGTVGVDPQKMEAFRQSHPKASFVSALLGEDSTEPPRDHFDLICSASVIEHIPVDQLPGVFGEIWRLLRPGGIVANSYDIFCGSCYQPVFDAHERTGLEWLKSGTTADLAWDPRTVIVEDPRTVMEGYLAGQPREQRRWPGNFVTILTAAVKPKDGRKRTPPRSPLVQRVLRRIRG